MIGAPFASLVIDETSIQVATSSQLDLTTVWKGNELATFDSNLREQSRFLVAKTILKAAVNPAGTCIAVLFDDHGEFLSPSGVRLFSYSWQHGLIKSRDCLFMPDGKHCWTISDSGLLYIDTISGSILASRNLAFLHQLWAGCNVQLRLHPEGDIVAIMVNASSDHATTYWACFEQGKITVYREPSEKQSSLIFFNQSGSEYLAIYPGVLCRKEFPSGRLIGQLVQEDAFLGEDNDDDFGLDTWYTSDDAALLSTNNGLLFKLNVASMKVEEHFELESPHFKSGRGMGLVHEFFAARNGRILVSTFLRAKTLLSLWDLSVFVGQQGSVAPVPGFASILKQQGIVF